MDKRELVQEAPTVEEAVDAALEELGVQQDAVNFEVLEQGGRAMFGLGSDRPAKVRVWIKDSFVEELERSESSPDGTDSFTDEAPDSEVSKPAGEDRAHVDLAALSDDELDSIADAAVETIKSILASFGIDATIEEYEGDEGELIFDIVGSDELAVLIGRHGRTLDALQALVAAVAGRRVGFRCPVVVDVEGYRHRRKVKLEEMAQRAADRASRQKTPVRMRPMTGFERRVVHMALRDDRRVITESEGEEPNRQLVVKPRS